MNIELTLVGAGEYISFGAITERARYLRFSAPDGSTFDLPCSEEQIARCVEFAGSLHGRGNVPRVSAPTPPAPEAPAPKDVVFDPDQMDGVEEEQSPIQLAPFVTSTPARVARSDREL